MVLAKRKSENILLSINRHVEFNFAVPDGVTVVYQDKSINVTNLDLWVDVNPLTHGAGRSSETLVQFDVYSRIRGRVSGGDRYSANVDDAADKLHAALNVQSIPIFKFATPASPVLVPKAVLMVQNSAGKFGQPETDQILGFEEGVVRRSLTYRFRMPEDAIGAPFFYD